MKKFSVVSAGLERCSIPQTYPKLALLCDGYGADVLLEDLTDDFARASSMADKNGNFNFGGIECKAIEAVTLFKRVSVCLYVEFVKLFQPFKKKVEVVLEMTNGQCVVAADDSVIYLRNCSVKCVVFRLQPTLCRVLRTREELTMSEINDVHCNYSKFARKIAIDGEGRETYSVLFFNNTKGFVCIICGKQHKSLRDAAEHSGDAGKMEGFRKVGLAANGSLLFSDTNSSDFVIYKPYLEKYSHAVDADALRLAIQTRANKRPRTSVIP